MFEIKGNKQWFSTLNNVEHDRIVSSTQKNFGTRDAVRCSDDFLSVGNNPGVLKSTEYTKPYVFTISMNLLLTAGHQYEF